MKKDLLIEKDLFKKERKILCEYMLENGFTINETVNNLSHRIVEAMGAGSLIAVIVIKSEKDKNREHEFLLISDEFIKKYLDRFNLEIWTAEIDKNEEVKWDNVDLKKINSLKLKIIQNYLPSETTVK